MNNQTHRRPRRPFHGLVTNRSGVSAVEFALLLPFMLLLYLGGFELGNALTIDRKVTHVTSSLADLITQSKSISDADMDNILDAAASVITPYDTGLLRIKVSGVTIDDEGKATVDWSDARNDTPLAEGSTIEVPDEIRQPLSYLVTAEIHYDYTPSIGYVLTGSFDMMDEFFLRPRLSQDVKRISG